MKLIKFTDSEASMSMEVIIDGTDLWHYEYSGDDVITNSSKLGKPKNHPLGLCKNLDGDRNKWRIHLGNKSANPIEINLQINWFENGELIETWIPDEANEDGKVDLAGNDGVEITDSALITKK